MNTTFIWIFSKMNSLKAKLKTKGPIVIIGSVMTWIKIALIKYKKILHN